MLSHEKTELKVSKNEIRQNIIFAFKMSAMKKK